jgi:signal transduction histidine kinase
MSNSAPRSDADAPGSEWEVLVVEDNPVYSAWLAGLLRHEGSDQHRRLRVSESSTMASARAILAERQIDAVLLDLNLPDSDGLDTVTAFTALCPGIAIIVVSANDDEDTALKALSRGAQEYIFKGREQEGSIFRTLCRSMERKCVELQLALAKEKALQNERMAAIGMLASGVAHEYNNIGAVILGNADLILGQAELSTSVRQRVERIREAAERAAAVTNGLLAYVRGFRDGDQRVCMQDVVRNTWQIAESTLTRHGIVSTVELPAEPLEVIGNMSILGQVLLNLVINASHAMAEHQPRHLRVGIFADDSGNGVVMTVSDTGHGIPAQHLEQIFLPFFSTKSTGGPGREIVGTGLGLAVCRTFVQQHGGTITVDSREGGGSTFRVWLPRASLPVPEVPLPTTPFARDAKGRQVLILDDEDGVREFFAMTLGDLGMVVAQVATVAEGIAQFNRVRPEVVLTDWLMPGATGREMVEYLMTIPVAQRPAILVISGNLAQEDRGWLNGIPGVVILDKPIPLRELQAAVLRVLGTQAENRPAL